MKNIFEKHFIPDFIAAFLFVICSFTLFFIPISVNKSVWENYRILFLPMDSDENLILEEMRLQGIRGAVSSADIEKRFSPLEDKDLYGYPFTLKELYSQWFLNDQENLRYIYIPSFNKIGFKFLYFLANNTDGFYLEDISCFSFFQFAGAAIFFAACIFFSGRKKLILLFLGAPIVIFAGFEKGILAFTAILFFLYAQTYWIQAVFGNFKLNKEQIKRRIKKNSIIVFIPIFSLTVLSFNSALALPIFLCAFVSGLCLVFIAEKARYLIEKKKDTVRLHKGISPYVMTQESIERIWSTKNLFRLSSLLVIIICVFSFILFFSLKKVPKEFGNIVYFPMPQKSVDKEEFSVSSYESLESIRQGDSLPDLGSYICDCWFEAVIPYLNVNEPLNMPESGSIVEFKDFTADENGVFKENKSIVFKFDDSFLKDTLSFRNKSSIEDMLYSQKKFVSVSYDGKEFPIKRYGKAAFAVSLFSILLPLTLIILRVLKK